MEGVGSEDKGGEKSEAVVEDEGGGRMDAVEVLFEKSEKSIVVVVVVAAAFISLIDNVADTRGRLIT